MLRSWFAIGLGVVACESAPRSQVEEPASPVVQAHAKTHVDAAADLERAIVQGRLADAHDVGGWFVAHPMTDHGGWQNYLDELRSAASNIERANDLATAGVELGRMGRACGGCHQAAGVHVASTGATVPDDVSSLAAQMQRHEWAAGRLWEGVSGPIDRAWIDGANTMLATPCDVIGKLTGKPSLEVFELAERLHDQADHARALVDLDARANHFGELMQTCAGCHGILRPRPVMDTQPLVSSRGR